MPLRRLPIAVGFAALTLLGACAASPEEAGDDDAASEDALIQAACPPGTTLLKRVTSCGARGAQVTSGFDGASSRARAGHVVAASGFDETRAPCLPTLVCRDDSAPTLVFSDSPEMPNKDGILYTDTLPAGRYRAYVYHANGSATPRRFPVTLHNAGAAEAHAVITKRGVVRPSHEYAAIGRDVAAMHMTSSLRTVVKVPPGARVLLDAELAGLTAQKDDLVQAMIDFESDATLKIDFTSVSGDRRADVTPLDLPVLARDGHDRGTFKSAGLVLVAPQAAAVAADTGARRLRLGTGEVDPLFEGVDAVTGKPLKLGGNYGVTYDVRVAMPRGGTIALSPRGGEWAGGLRLAATNASFEGAVPAGADPLGDPHAMISMGALGAGDARLQFVTGGGSSTPLDLIVVRK
jgi:hypothetical protein